MNIGHNPGGLVGDRVGVDGANDRVGDNEILGWAVGTAVGMQGRLQRDPSGQYWHVVQYTVAFGGGHVVDKNEGADVESGILSPNLTINANAIMIKFIFAVARTL